MRSPTSPRSCRRSGSRCARTPSPAITLRDGQLRALEFADGSTLGCEKIFFAIGQYPADDLGAQLGCVRDEDGHIEVDDAYHTSVRNVFAAGDIVPGPQLGIAAAADGAIAALAIHKSLVPEERKLKRHHPSEGAKPSRMLPPRDGARGGARGGADDARVDERAAHEDAAATPWEEPAAAT